MLSLADLLAQNTGIDLLILNECKMDNNSLSNIFKALLNNFTIVGLDITAIKPFKQIDLSIIGEITNKKKLKTLKLDSYDINMAKVFSVDNLVFTTDKFENLKGQGGGNCCPEISRIFVHADSRKVKTLFEVINGNKNIKEFSIRQLFDPEKADGVLRSLKSNTTLSKFAVYDMKISDFNILREMIEKNSTLEELTLRGFIASRRNATILLKALENNKSLTRINLHSLVCHIKHFRELLTANPYISFIDDSNWPPDHKMSPEEAKIKEEVITLNELNKQNARKRLLARRMNVIILARSYLSRVVPMEVWQEIFMYLDAQLEYFALFQRSLATE